MARWREKEDVWTDRRMRVRENHGEVRFFSPSFFSTWGEHRFRSEKMRLTCYVESSCWGERGSFSVNIPSTTRKDLSRVWLNWEKENERWREWVHFFLLTLLSHQEFFSPSRTRKKTSCKPLSQMEMVWRIMREHEKRERRQKMKRETVHARERE